MAPNLEHLLRVFGRDHAQDGAAASLEGRAGLDFLEALFAVPSFRFLVAGERHAALARDVLRTIPELGRLVHDVHIAVLMREHGIRTIYSRDTDFHRFPFIERIDPVARA